ncbi:hypothetical protein E1B28_005973 [Marasmius oreades]|uniref:Uncharacterized protein n=1 Tax=Marasmius oreades TaxID=181124 RepID=A0A9P7S4Y5_9AGAR|nr:uncharacterized protein E1B28_005973 [Marasmius oreades]KAG7095197.1 hypothetical protein E1B28_005973 [Marasmius oreades]
MALTPHASDLEDDLKRMITIVFWYSPDTEPLRLQQIAPQFPLFQLSRLTSLVADLGLTENSYLDTYNHQFGSWEQHTISTIRIVERNQRLLYRIRRNLLNGLREDECLTLDEEIEMQPAPTSPSSKRPASDGEQVSPPSKKRPTPGAQFLGTSASHPSHSSSGTLVKDGSAVLPLSPAPLSIFPKSSENGEGYVPSTYQHQSFFSAPETPETVTLPMHLLNPPSEPAPIPYHPHPPLRRWPNDYTVAQLSQGFLALEALSSHSHVTVITSDGERVSVATPNMSQKAAFERVFRTRYVKSTVCRHRSVWKRAPREIRDEFESYGDDERGSWGEFVRRVEGKPPGKSALSQQQQQIQFPHPHAQVGSQIIHPSIAHTGQTLNLPPGPPVPPMTIPNQENLIFHSPDINMMGTLTQQAQQAPPRENSGADGDLRKDNSQGLIFCERVDFAVF